MRSPPAPLHFLVNIAHIRQSRPDSGLGFQVYLSIRCILGDTRL